MRVLTTGRVLTTMTATDRDTPSDAGDTVRIRAAAAEDVPAVAALDEQVTGLAKPDYWRDQFARYGTRRQSERFFLVAEGTTGPLAGRVLGFVIGEIRAWEFGSPPCGWVFAVYVDTRVRLGGIGTRLLSAICDRFRAAGVDKVRTMLARDDHLLMSFFRSQGMMAGPYVQLEMDLE